MVSLRVLNTAAAVTVAGCALFASSIARAAPPVDGAALGQMLFRQQCIACHGEKGEGDGHHTKHLKKQPNSFKGKPIRLNVEKAMTLGVSDTPGHAVWNLLTPQEVASLIEYVDGLSKDQGKDEKNSKNGKN